jgi:hypothetical protein
MPQEISNLKSEISNLHYRVLFMEREMEEILDSQDSMLARLGKPTRPGADIAKAYRQQVRHAKSWLTGRGIPALSVSYADLVHRPDEALPPLAAMRAVIDPTLHRARSAAAAVTPFSPSAIRAGGTCENNTKTKTKAKT